MVKFIILIKNFYLNLLKVFYHKFTSYYKNDQIWAWVQILYFTLPNIIIMDFVFVLKKGQGYDEEDSFIDNSEAQDERVPSDMAPKKGGFYINKGNLKMEKIEEQKLKKKAAKKQQKLQNAKKHKEIKEGDSSTDEDFNPNEDEAKVSTQTPN